MSENIETKWKDIEISETLTWFEEILDNSIDSMTTVVRKLLESEDEISKLKCIKCITDWNSCSDLPWIVSKLVDIILKQKKSSQETILQLEEEKTKAIKLNKELISKNEELQKDKLTWLGNRYKFEQDFQKLLQEDLIVSIWVLDIDDFKKINDTYWHSVWDKVLEYFAKFLNSKWNLEKMNFYRFWGEEFVITYKGEKRVLCLELKKMLLELHKLVVFSKVNKNLKIKFTFSGWVSQYQDWKTFDNLFEEADDLLYIVKKSGKNNVISKEDIK